MTGSPAPAGSLARHGFGFWAVAYAFLAVLSFSTAPSPLYVLYAHRDHFSSLMITLIYAAYAAGVAGSLLLASHLSDVHGRRPHLLAGIALAIASGVLFIAWPALPGLFTARVLCGVSVGLTVAVATAYLSEAHQAHRPGAPGTRPQLAAAAANLGGLSLGALLAGLLAQYAGHPLVLPYLVLLAMLAVAAVAVAVAPETRPRQRPLPAWRPQRASAPDGARPLCRPVSAGHRRRHRHAVRGPARHPAHLRHRRRHRNPRRCPPPARQAPPARPGPACCHHLTS